MKKQNRENEKMDRNTHRQETEEATGREKVSKGAFRKRTQEEIATKPKITAIKTQKKKRNRGEKHKNKKYLQFIIEG